MSADDPMILALPSKGRLKEQCEAWLRGRGLALRQSGGARGYAGLIEGPSGVLEGLDVRLMGASDIARALLAGEVHAGVTGEDILRELSARTDELVAIEARLGFGRADVVVAVPDGWIDVTCMADLAEVAADMRRASGRRFRVATKFLRLAGTFFAQNGVSDHRIVDSAGATEGAPAAGLADCIVDITTTGATLAANGLKILPDGVILRSEACLVVNRALTGGSGFLDRLSALAGPR
jgi:ATP phosphoribosyltransferase